MTIDHELGAPAFVRLAPPTFALLLLTTLACEKKPEAFMLTGVSLTHYHDAKVTVRGQTVPVDATGFARFGAGAISDGDEVQIEYTTPCGTDSITVKADGPVSNGGVITLTLPSPKNPVRLLFDPALAGKEIAQPRLKIPAPTDARLLPVFVDLAFGDCARTIEVDGRKVTLPDRSGKAAHFVLVARDKSACYVSGLALYGEAKGSCKPESSEKLTGQDAYEISERPTFVFEPVDDKAVSSHSSCTNRAYLQHCR